MSDVMYFCCFAMMEPEAWLSFHLCVNSKTIKCGVEIHNPREVDSY